MRAFILLILIGIVAFLVTPTVPEQDTIDLEQETQYISDESNIATFEEEVVVLEEEVTVVEEELLVAVIEETIVEASEPVPEPVEEVVEEETPKISFSEINTSVREALVNVFCTTKSGGSFKPITGSGIIIDERGIILTNAHVAQYFLLKDYLVEDFVQCTIRTGSPAKSKYKAKLLFISPSWIENNADSITQQSPKGTGEDDYALILITGRTDPNKTLPETFSFIPLEYNSDGIKLNDEVLLAAYPAGFLGGISIQKDLYISSTVIKVIELFTFASGTLDLFSIGGSVVAQQGSSGGAVVSDELKMLGIIVTSSVADSTEDRDLRAITIAHINRSFTGDTGVDLQTLFNSDIITEANTFNENVAPILTRFLVDKLEK